jgi:hypothetical protein
MVILLGLGPVWAGGQAKPVADSQMGGMDMGAPATSDAKAAGQEKQMDMGGCKMMGSGDGKMMGDCMGKMQGGMGKTDVAAIPAGTLRITNGDKTADWTVATLASLPHTSVTVMNEKTKSNEVYSGVALIDLLAKLGVATQPMGKALDAYLVAEGTDGYKVVFSIGEVTPYINGSTVIVADSVGGQPIGKSGPLQLVASNDKHPARMVHSLVMVAVHAAE